MIMLRADCLIFQTTDGVHVPCSAEWVTMELMGEGATLVDPEIVRHAAAAVLHYFKEELQQDQVSVGEFAVALEKALRGFGLTVFADGTTAAPKMITNNAPEPRALVCDLRSLAVAANKGFELLFFPQLRDEVRRGLEEAPQILHFQGLRGCVKQLTGARRWSPRCDALNDQIVEFLRHCWQSETVKPECALLVN